MTSDPVSFRAIASTTSSPASVAGPWPCASPDGTTRRPYGRAPALASLSPRQASAWGLLTSGTSGPSGTSSSSSAGLQSSLESRLRRRLGAPGSPEYVLTWKRWDMPSGAPICRLQASERTTIGQGFSLWPTPCATDHKSVASHQHVEKRKTHSRGVRWPETAARRGWTGQPNPEFSRALMGFPVTWHHCAPTATPSSLRSRRSS